MNDPMALLENEAFTNLIDEMKAETISLWSSTPPEDVAERERLYIQLSALDQMKTRIEAKVRDMMQPLEDKPEPWPEGAEA